ncbi:MAG: hypothetical protein ACE5NP_07945, partial [Anaerolineae bacterium]
CYTHLDLHQYCNGNCNPHLNCYADSDRHSHGDGDRHTYSHTGPPGHKRGSVRRHNRWYGGG